MESTIPSDSSPNRKKNLLASGSMIFGFFIPLFVCLFAGLNIYFVPLPILGLVFGLKWRDYHKISRKSNIGERFLALTGTAFSLLWLGLFLGLILVPTITEKIELVTKIETYNGSSEGLKQTVVLPTLDSEVPKGENAIWCSSFQLAWNVLKNDVVKEPVKLLSTESVANQLNSAKETSDDLEQYSYYATSGLAKDGIIKKICSDMAERFPSESLHSFKGMKEEDLVVYSFLEANVKFTNPYQKNNDDFIFKDSKGNETNVASFGIWDHDLPKHDKIREQVKILYFYPLSDKKIPHTDDYEFAIDLCKYTQPYQIVLARVTPQNTLRRTIETVQKKVSNFPKHELYNESLHELKSAVLIVPNMFWKIQNHFKELEGKFLGNTGFEDSLIKQALQVVQFRLDRSGAMLKSYAKMSIELSAIRPQRFEFDQPFLIYMKKRGATNPFFVMWVDNTELLTKK